MKRIYLDNAATTPLDKEVLEAMMPYLTEKFCNPSSIYSYGRESRMAVENARKMVAKLLHAHPSEIFFTSGGTESSNTAINASVNDLGCKHIITSPIEHHATLHTVNHLKNTGVVSVSYLNISDNGHVDIAQLEEILSSTSEKTLVTLMHANNEIGNITDIKAVADLCEQYNAIFHCDTVQTVGHFELDLSKIPVHFITGAGHKFHGPKGVGILYVCNKVKISPYIIGGSQERNMRAGTENVYGIVGFARALQLAVENMEKDAAYIYSLKQYFAKKLKESIPEVVFNGDSFGNSLYTVLNVGFPKTEKSEMLLFNMDVNNICVSGGSACSSGANTGSHVIAAFKDSSIQETLRFSFSKHNTYSEIDEVVSILKSVV